MSKELKLLAPKKPLILGNIGAPYGIRGWIRIFSYTENEENIFDYKPWFIQRMDGWEIVELEDWKNHSSDLIIKINGINERNAVSLFKNCNIISDSEKLPILKEGDYYWKDIIGCQVFTITGYKLGKVIKMIETGSNDVMVVKSNLKDEFGIKERLIPFLYGWSVKKVDLATLVIKVDWDPAF